MCADAAVPANGEGGSVAASAMVAATPAEEGTGGGEPSKTDEGGLYAWFGSPWGGAEDSEEDEEYEARDGTRRLATQGRRQRQDPMLVKLRFRRYPDHVPSHD